MCLHLRMSADAMPVPDYWSVAAYVKATTPDVNNLQH